MIEDVDWASFLLGFFVGFLIFGVILLFAELRHSEPDSPDINTRIISESELELHRN